MEYVTHQQKVLCQASMNLLHGRNGIAMTVFLQVTRAVALSLCMDGVNPFSKERTKYSMCPMILTVLNLPYHLRIQAGSTMLVGIIPGRNEPKETDQYVDILVDELLELNGTVMQDGLHNESFKLRTEILLHQLDYPGQNKVFHCQGMK